jgi:hypothetical protein
MTGRLQVWTVGALVLGTLLGWASARASGQADAPSSSWLPHAGEDRFATIERHLRGLDVAMVEIGYRYSELHFAVADRNWGYADYQAGKIELALNLAVERRPARAASAGAFLAEDWPSVTAGIGSRDVGRAEAAMKLLRTACMKCHVAESVPHLTVQPPERRLAPIRHSSE